MYQVEIFMKFFFKGTVHENLGFWRTVPFKPLSEYINEENMKQDIRIYVPYSRPNGWNEWAEFFVGRLEVT